MGVIADQRAFIIVFGAIKLGKCLAATARIPLADGRVVTVADLVAAGGHPEILALDRDFKLRPATVSAFHDNGIKAVVRVTLASGRRIDVTSNHPLLTSRGWLPTTEIRPTDLVATPRVIPAFGADDCAEGKVKALAYHLADGSFVNSAIVFTSGNAEKVADLRAAIAVSFPDVEMRQATLTGVDTISYRIVRVAKDRKTSSYHAFLRACGLDGKQAATKFVPSFVFTLRKPLLAIFLSRYLGCDGAVHRNGMVSFSSASEEMLRQISHLLLRFGVFGHIRTKRVNGVDYYEWQTTDASAVEALRREVGIFTKPIPPRMVGRSNHDRLPITWRQIGKHPARGGRSECALDGYVSRFIGAERFDVGDEVHRLAHSDLWWDAIESITPLGPMQTYDLTVPMWHNFVADDVIAHNTCDALMSFPRSVFIAAPGALKAAIGVAGFEPPAGAIRDLAGLVEIVALVESIGKLPVKNRPDAVVVDDLTLFVAREVAKLEGTTSGFELWGIIYRRILRLREAARASGVHVVFTMHELPPRDDKGLRLPGSVALPGKKLPYDVPAAADMVLRAQPVPSAMGSGLGWPVLYRCDPTDVEWRTGDRHNVTPDMSPMNLGEILRLVAKEAGAVDGWAPRRAPGLEWHEPWIETAASNIDVKAVDAAREVLRALNAACLKKDPDPRHAAWAIRDAWDRAVLRYALKSHHTKHFGI